ncbi:hypothetical protein GCM10020227_06490 [Streptomyces flavovirens]
METQRLRELIGAARTGRGGALVLRGEAGIGKSTLLEHVEEAASGFRVLRAGGSELEAELPFAALHQLCLPVLGHLTELPAEHRRALRIAFDLASGTPDVFRVGLATLGLLNAAGQERPVLCVVDDAHWLDAASSKALAFLARRISAESVAMVLAVRLPYEAGELDVLPSLGVDGLSDAEARALLAAQSHETLDEQVRDRLVAEARGNPLALLALPRAGGFAPPRLTPVPTRVGQEFRATLSGLPAQARLLLTIAGADPTGDPGLLWPAARRLDIDLPAAGAAATATGLVEFGTRVRFYHPLARAAAYDAAGVGERLLAHHVLAEVTDPVADPDRRAWHRAQAAAAPDEDVAAELERSASRAQARGGAVATAAFLERAAELSLDAAQRIERTLAATRAHLDAGATDKAATLLRTAESAGLDELQQAETDLLRGRIALVRVDDSEGPAWMLRAARRLAPLDPERSRESYLEALEMSLLVGRANGVMDAVLAEAGSAPPHPPDILDALDILTTNGHRAAVPLIKEALDGAEGPLWTRHPALGIILAAELWDPDTHTRIIEWLLKSGRESGSPLVLRLGLAQAASAAALTGDLDGAMAAIAEEEAIADATGAPGIIYHRLQLAAMRGRREEASALLEAVMTTATATGQVVSNVHWASAVLNNGLADYQEARRTTCHRGRGTLHRGVRPAGTGGGRRAVRRTRRRRRRAGVADRTHRGLRNPLGPGDRRLRASAGDGRGERLPGSGRPPHRHTDAPVPGQGPPPVRGMAAAAGPQAGLPAPSAHRARAVLRRRDRGVRPARGRRAARHGRDGAQPHRSRPRPAHHAGAAHSAAGRHRCDVERGGRPAVPQPTHRGHPPAQPLPQAGHQLPQAAQGPARPAACRPRAVRDVAPSARRTGPAVSGGVRCRRWGPSGSGSDCSPPPPDWWTPGRRCRLRLLYLTCRDTGPAGQAEPRSGGPTTVSRSTTKISVEPAGINGEGDCLP